MVLHYHRERKNRFESLDNRLHSYFSLNSLRAIMMCIAMVLAREKVNIKSKESMHFILVIFVFKMKQQRVEVAIQVCSMDRICIRIQWIV